VLVVLASSVAAMAFGMAEMVIEAARGDGFWAPLRYIASVFTRGTDTDPSFSVIPVVVGLMGHMMNSIILGALFALAVWRLRANALTLAMLGAMYGAGIFAVMWWGVLPAIDPAMKIVSGAGFLITHLIFGMMLGLGIAVARQLQDRTAGRQPIAPLSA
jgi:hypothetical protein